MEKLISPCTKCHYRKDRRICFKRCRLLAAYRKKLGNPFENCHLAIEETLRVGSPGCFRITPLPRWLVEEERYDEEK